MMLDWNVYPAELNERVKEMSKLAANAVAGFIALDRGFFYAKVRKATRAGAATQV
jgi:hypothetical protein